MQLVSYKRYLNFSVMICFPMKFIPKETFLGLVRSCLVRMLKCGILQLRAVMTGLRTFAL